MDANEVRNRRSESQRLRRERERILNISRSHRSLAQIRRRERERNEQNEIIFANVTSPPERVDFTLHSSVIRSDIRSRNTTESETTPLPALSMLSQASLCSTSRNNRPTLTHSQQSPRALAQRGRRERERNEQVTSTLNQTVYVGEIEGDELHETEIEVHSIASTALERHSLGQRTVECTHCSALHWIDEKLSNSSAQSPMFGSCCHKGKIKLPPPLPLPPALHSLFEGSDTRARDFRKNIRQFNSTNALTSFGTALDDRVLHGTSPSAFTIHGELYHRIGSLLPDGNRTPVYAQLYIYDALEALEFRSQRNEDLNREVQRTIQQTLLETNALCKIYKSAFEVLSQCESGNQGDLRAFLHYTPGTDPRRYNLPTSNEIAVVLPGDGSQVSTTRDIVLHLRDHGLERISECHPAYLPSHYVLLYPHGELGWSPDMLQWDVENNTPGNKRLTQLQYYGYNMFKRPNQYSAILRGGRLYQQWLVDAWAAYEQNKLRWLKGHQAEIRAEVYKGLTDIAGEGLNPNEVGKRFILPATHIGSPRHMYEIYQDSMAITRYNKHPDIFVTVTANPNWPEIKGNLEYNETFFDRPELVATVFELKRQAIMKEILQRRIFGKVVGYVYTIEFQKRGLPHMHALFFLDRGDKISTSAQVDRIVCAEFPDPSLNPMLFETVKRCMIHGPCGARNKDAPCCVNGTCKSRYPRPFVDKTSMDRDGYPIYMRRLDGKVYYVNGQPIDNRDVVPYNPYLTAMFDCHINVEVCASVRAVKYINKYIYKGFDKTTMVVGAVNDEIKQYIDGRYIGAIEAAWHLLGHRMHAESPNVVRLALHLEGMHKVTYKPTDTMTSVLASAATQQSTLTAFLKCCRENPTSRNYTYQEFPQHFVWHIPEKKWTPRKSGFAIGRLYFAGPREGERFYLRLLLTVVKGPQSFNDLKTFMGFTWSTFKEACVARGLLEEDNEWTKCLEEASLIKTGNQLRRLFAVILLECSPTQPGILWDKFALHLCDDLPHTLRQEFGIETPNIEQTKDYGLYLMNNILLESGKALGDFHLPTPIGNWSIEASNRLIWEHRQLQTDGLTAFVDSNVARFNAEQQYVFDKVTDSVRNNHGNLYFLNGSAGTGKTFLYNTIAAECRRKEFIVIMVASSGIASLLLAGGRTAHSTFRIPLDILDNSVCSFSKQSMHAALFREAKLIIWDEVPMQHRHCVEAVDRTLQDVLDNNRPFGGITVVLGGDFKQTLPVITKGSREDCVAASLRRSPIWGNLEVLNLVQNMRLDMTNVENANFGDFLLQVGTNPSGSIDLPSGIKKCNNYNDLIKSIYPGLQDIGTASATFLNDRTILAARNDDVGHINAEALNMFPGEVYQYLGADKVIEDNLESENIGAQFPSEMLNSLEPSSLPPFKLKLKIGCPIMLLRNIAAKDGLCNGTRLMVTNCSPHVIEAIILTGDKIGNRVFIPRITLTPSDSEMSFQMSRRQFPVRLAFAMTINKSQGQSVKYVGIDLQNPVFNHGQLYVALSRCTSSTRLAVLLQTASENNTPNIVYPEVLL